MLGRAEDAYREKVMMRWNAWCRWVCAGMLLLTVAGVCTAQPDESMAALRRENDALRQRVARLEAQLEAAREESELLREQAAVLREAVTALTRELENRPRQVVVERESEEDIEAGGAGPVEYPDPALADPMAYPQALLAALQESYAETLNASLLENSDLSTYLGMVREWATTSNRMYRGRIDWVVSIADEEGAIPVDQPLRVYVVDRETLEKLHRDPFVVRVGARDRRRVDEESSRKAWRMLGTLESDVRVNPQRDERGVFNTPPFIGPYAEFVYDLRVVSITPWEVEEEE